MTERSQETVAVVGAGAWGTALAAHLARRGHRVTLWALEDEVVQAIEADGENTPFLAGHPLPETLRATNDIEAALSGASIALSVVPAQYAGSVWEEAARHLEPDAIPVSASKGIETRSLRRMQEVLSPLLSEAHRDRYTVLSGPSFAAEVADGEPTAVVAASDSRPARLRVQEAFQSDRFRVYTNPDVPGVELGGALKNVMALAAGVAAGLGFGHNTRAALITRGLAEMTRLGVALGARKETFAGLAGLGDLVLTCTGELSRNRTVGFRLGSGETLEEILSEMRSVAEGVKTSEAVVRLAEREGVEMPIARQVHAILTEGKAPAEALRTLMLREPKPEEWS